MFLKEYEFRKKNKKYLFSSFLKILVVDILYDSQCFREEEVDEERREIDLSLVEVGLSSAQYGALVVESVCIFLCEHVCECAHIKVFVSCTFSVLMPSML